ncbi:molybdate ABC transporter substrate-binding protein [Kineococcus terrestris]|uniref:molybdate ABC transporter substrate-binding protein n=1 Tax=Kineococcus terrestris TaxID=2044856 RepID=UPI0034DB12A3
MRRALTAAVASALLLAGCGAAPGAARGGEEDGELLVLAAASLTGTFEELGRRFEEQNPGTAVTFSFGASSALATQVRQGVPADVLATASEPAMASVADEGLVGEPVAFARNETAIAVPLGNPAGVTGVADLARPGTRVALCQVQVPCGAAAQEVFRAAGVDVRPVTEEADVKATLAKVVLGEVDAALVYVTDVRAAADGVEAVEVPADVNASTTYPVATLTGSARPELAQRFVDLVLSDQGRDVLRDAGFSTP